MRRVLVIEDDDAIRLLYRVNLTLEGLDVVEVDNGAEGPGAALRHRPDVVVLDLRLPDCNGREVLRQLREEPVTAHLPVLVISATADEQTREELLAAGAAGFITKPFNPAQLGSIVRELLETHEADLSSAERDRLVLGAESGAPGGIGGVLVNEIDGARGFDAGK